MFFKKERCKIAVLILITSVPTWLQARATRIDIRSQSENAARDVAGLVPHIHAPLNGYHGTIAITNQYSRSCDPGKLTRALFGADACDDTTITIKGSAVAGRNNQHDWLAENFYLSQDFVGELSLEPRIEQSITDVNLYFGLNNVANSLFVRVHAPVVWTKWHLHAHETITQEGVGAGWLGIYPFTSGSIMLGSFTEYACQELVPTPIYSIAAGEIHTAYPLTVAKICPCPEKKAALSDIQTDIGWDYMRDTYHVGAFARIVAPAGTRPHGDYLFEPIIGNGKHWELGIGATSHVELWHHATRKHSLTLSLNGSLTHLFNTHQQRVFDLKGFGPLSRYLLVEKINEPVATLSVSPAANLTYQTVNVSVPVQTDIVAMLSYAREFLSLDLGYNFWARSCEKIACTTSCSCPCDVGLQAELSDQQWRVIHGNETIHDLGSTDPVILDAQAVDYAAARTRGISHKVFTNISYNWLANGTWVPYLGAGAEIELGQHDGCASSACCKDVALSQWSVWIKGGVSF